MSTLTINLDQKLKTRAQKKSKQDGLNLTALITQLLKTYVQSECKLCVQLERAGKKNLRPEIVASIEEADREFANGTAKLYNSVEEMSQDILNEPEDSDDLRDKNDKVV